ncbi:MAG TPA: SRPBCC family protein, partial [Thermomonospora sp.]|nr:SRPBCC family protein [Thermomonospora sp.]
MELDHEFTVPAPVDQAWSALLDAERVARAMPGATLDSTDGDTHTGRLRVRLGAMTITYRGTARLAGADKPARTLTVEAEGKEARGSGTASAVIRLRLTETDDGTHVAVHITLDVTGRPAQFGRPILAEAAAKLITRFTKSLTETLEPPTTKPTAPAPPA